MNISDVNIHRCGILITAVISLIEAIMNGTIEISPEFVNMHRL